MSTITLRIKQKQDLVAFEAFDRAKNGQGVPRSQNRFSEAPCAWELDISDYSIREGFHARINWYQLQEYDAGGGEVRTKRVMLYTEQFDMPQAALQALWETVGTPISPTDDLAQKIREITRAGAEQYVISKGYFGVSSKNDFA